MLPLAVYNPHQKYKIQLFAHPSNTGNMYVNLGVEEFILTFKQ